MDAINLDILQQLQEYANVYFDAIVDLNTKGGKCELKEGKYGAKDMTDNSHKSVFGHYYPLPEDSMFSEVVTLESGTFKCSFPYRRIFQVLNDWETMCRAGKLKAVFEIGDTEVKSAKVLTNEKTVLGEYRTKTMKLQHIGGNWWGQPKEIRKGNDTTGYYELNGVMFAPGKTFMGDVSHERNQKFAEEWNDIKMVESMIGFIASRQEQRNAEYYKAVLDIAGINAETEDAKAIAQMAIERRREEDEKQARELAERNAREKETRRKRLEQEERMKREVAERLEKSKEKFISGKMISREEFEDIAESIGYEINIRTVGTLRKRITWIEAKDGDNVTVYGTKTRRGLDGTFDVIREVYVKLKETAAQAIEESEPIKHISEIMETCKTYDPEARDYTDEYKYYIWLANHIPEHEATNKNVTEIILEEVRERVEKAATMKAHGVPKCDIEGAVYVVVNGLAKMADILQFYNRAEPPQSPRIPETANHAAGPKKRATGPRNKPKQVVWNLRTTEPRTCKNSLIVANIPRHTAVVPQYSTVYHFADVREMAHTPPGYSPPIRGDCITSINHQIADFKPS